MKGPLQNETGFEIDFSDLQSGPTEYLEQVQEMYGHPNTKLTMTVLLELSQKIWALKADPRKVDVMVQEITSDIMFKRGLPECDRETVVVFIRLMVHRIVKNYQFCEFLE